MDMMRKKDRTPEEQDTIRKSKESCVIIAATGSQLLRRKGLLSYVRDLDMCIIVQLPSCQKSITKHNSGFG